MTAIVGILNKSGIAIAADSAMTISNSRGRKVLNTGTKIFRLSKKYPISVTLYSSMNFMGTPWEVIIKEYCRRRGGSPKNTVKDYVDDFLDFLHDEDYFCNRDIQKHMFRRMLATYFAIIEERAQLVIDDPEEAAGRSDKEIFVDAMAAHGNYCKDKAPKCPRLEDYSFRSFQAENEETIQEVIEMKFGEEGVDDNQLDRIEHAIYEWIKTTDFLENGSTGLVFSGYGETDIFPCIYPIVVAETIGGRLRYSLDEDGLYQVDHDNAAAVCPFAQIDVMQTFMNGISPTIYGKVMNSIDYLADAVRTKICDELKEAGVGADILKRVSEISLEESKDEVTKRISDYLEEDSQEGLLSAVEMFNIQELASMAESLVSITNLQRHITSSEETVGGPVDVAVITRSEGFVWVKRKLWFDPQLNKHILPDE